MKRLALLFTALALVAAVPAQDDAPDHKVTVKPGQTVTVDGGPPLGVNPNYFPVLPENPVFPEGQCSHDPGSYCETTLIAFTHTKADKRTATVTLTPIHPVADFDLMLYRSDKTGKRGAQLGQCATFNQLDACGGQDSSERLSVKVTTTKKKKVVYVLAQVVYFAAPSTYELSVKY